MNNSTPLIYVTFKKAESLGRLKVVRDYGGGNCEKCALDGFDCADIDGMGVNACDSCESISNPYHYEPAPK